MPELPEVETIARLLQRDLAGATFASVLAARPDYVQAPPPSAAHHLSGRRVTRVHRHGKRLLVELDRGASLALHLGMSGRIFIVPAADAVLAHTHLRIALDDGARELRMQDPRRFGGAALRTSSENGAAARRNGANFGPLGPDALAIPLRDWRALLARPRTTKALLLDQAAIAGLGNIYVDEILWASRIHPLTRASRIPTVCVAESHRHLRRILRAAIGSGGSTLRDYRTPEGQAGDFQRWHKVYGREGEPCLRCGAKVVRSIVAGRSTHTCPRCQRAPRR